MRLLSFILFTVATAFRHASKDNDIVVIEAPIERLYDSKYWVPKRPAHNDTLPIRAVNRGLLRNGQPLQLRGISFNGIEAECHAPLGLWVHPLDFFFDVLERNQFNALRIPLAYEVMADLNTPIGNCVGAEPQLHQGIEAGNVISLILDKAYERGIMVLFDLHTIGGVITPLPWTDQVNEDAVVTAWVRFVQTFYQHPAFMGIEIKNEPHESMSLDRFLEHCSKVISNVHRYVPDYRGLYFISGVQINGPWGGSFDPNSLKPTPPESRKVVTSFAGLTHPNMMCVSDAYVEQVVLNPHVYGTSVRGEGVAYEGPADWERAYGFITSLQNHWNQSTIIPTEWGGFMTGSDLTYFMRWTDWHVNTKGFRSGGFYWTLAPFSQDTGGLLDDGYNLVQAKLDMIYRLSPAPTRIERPSQKRRLLRSA